MHCFLTWTTFHTSFGALPNLFYFSFINVTQLFQSKTTHPSLWNFPDRFLLSFNILLAHIPCEANSAADSLSRLQADPSLSIQIRLNDHVHIREIGVETATKTPDVAFPNNVAGNTSPDKLPRQIKTFLIN